MRVWREVDFGVQKRGYLENPGVDPGASRMLSERSTIWANPPALLKVSWFNWANMC